MAPNRGTRTSPLLLILGALLLWTALVVGGATRGVLRPDPFARHLAASLSDPRVSSYLSARITDAIVAQRPNLVSVRPVLESGVNAVVASPPFRAFVRAAAREAHHQLFEAAGKNVILSLPDFSVLIRGALENASPELAAKIPPSIETTLASPEAQATFARFISGWAFASHLLWVAWLMLGLGVAALVAAVWVASDRLTALVRAGGALFAVGVALLALLPAGRLIAAAITPDASLRGFIHGIWVAYLGALKPLAIINMASGLVLVSAGTTILEAVDPLARVKAVWHWITSPLQRRALLGRALLLLALGAFAAVKPATAATGLLFVLGLVLIFLGLREVFRLVLSTVPGVATAPTPGRTEARAWRTVAAVAAVLVLVLGAAALFVLREPPEPPEAVGVVTVCNGFAELCDRRIDQVVFPGAHNAMSNAEIPGWMFPHHNHAFPRQLADGIRALLIDVHYGVPAEQHVITDFKREGTSEKKIEEVLGPEATAAALRIRARFLGHETGVSGLYFCHGFCELGAYAVVPALHGVGEFLATNPGEVVLIVVEDYVTPEDLAKAFQDAGLMHFIYTGPLVRPFPTLRRLIDQDQRLLVFTESGRPGVPWLRAAFDFIQETPYSFHTAADFSCRPNR
ncbi:MAG TPA: hypothetical protein VMH39_03415, partial [Gemmatimonadaceae bacterium]|nr:hypothetical protein [Gemmatimonadaceae bacterium]